MRKQFLLLMLFLFNEPAFTDELFVKMDSLKGKIEIQRSGTSTWIVAQKGMLLKNNDCIKTLTDGATCLKWPDGTQVFVHNNSKILINIIPKKEPGFFLSHATIYFGAAFFLGEKTFAVKNSNAIDIYTPTSIISFSGSSFEIKFDSLNGKTTVKVINGTAGISNIFNGSSIYLSAPYRVSVVKNSGEMAQIALLKQDIDSMKLWIPASIIDLEISNQLAKSKRDFLILTGKAAGECLVAPFTNASTYKGPWQIGNKLAAALAKRLQNESPEYTVNYIDSCDDPIRLAKQNRMRYLITARIETFDIIQQAQISARADEYREFTTARVRFSILLSDIPDDLAIDQETISGEVSSKNKVENTWATISKMNFDLQDSTFSSSILGKAIDQALDQASDKLIKNFGK